MAVKLLMRIEMSYHYLVFHQFEGGMWTPVHNPCSSEGVAGDEYLSLKLIFILEEKDAFNKGGMSCTRYQRRVPLSFYLLVFRISSNWWASVMRGCIYQL